MRMLMGRSGIWAFVILMAAFVTILVSATPIFERLFVGGRRNHDYMPNQRTMVTPDPTLRDTEFTPELPEPNEIVTSGPEPDLVAGPTPEEDPLLWNTHALKRPTEDRRADMVQTLADYFDLGQDLWKVRVAAVKALSELKRKHGGYDLLGDPDGLRAMVYRARYFEPPMRDKKWRSAQEVSLFDVDERFKTVRSDELNIGFHLPYLYPKDERDLRPSIRPGPSPLVISTIEARDCVGNEDPARHLFKRRFGSKAWKRHHLDWITLVPVAPGGTYVRDGRVQRQYFNWQFVEFIRHYHIDFDRIVLDGGPEALLTACSAPMLYAGFVLRSGVLDERAADLVPNFAHVPVFVPEGNVQLARSLRRAGHRRVTVGNESDELRTWLASVRRRMPTTFTWRAHGAEQQFAHWINIERMFDQSAGVELEVSVSREANEIRIAARGTSEISLFLNDRIVSLDRPVRVVVNGLLRHAERIPRSLDTAFGEDPFRLRESMYFGLIFPGRIAHVAVPGASEIRDRRDAEVKAERYFGYATAALDRRRTDVARKALNRVIALGPTTWLARAQALLDELR